MSLNLLHRRFEGVKEEMQTQRLYAYENIFTYGGLLVSPVDSCLHFYIFQFKFKVDRLQIIVVAKKYIYVSQMFISRMPKRRAIPQLVSAPLNPIPIAEHFRRSHPPCEHSRGQHI